MNNNQFLDIISNVKILFWPISTGEGLCESLFRAIIRIIRYGKLRLQRRREYVYNGVKGGLAKFVIGRGSFEACWFKFSFGILKTMLF